MSFDELGLKTQSVPSRTIKKSVTNEKKTMRKMEYPRNANVVDESMWRRCNFEFKVLVYQ